VLQDLETCHWFCAPCNSKMGKVIPSIIKLTDRMAVVDNQVANLEREMKVMSGHMVKVKEDVARDLEKFSRDINNVKEMVDKQLVEISEMVQGQEGWREVVKKHVSSSMETVTEDIRQVQSILTELRAQAEEQREKESRRNNLVLYEVPESNADRAEDRNKADIAFCLQLFNNALQMGVAEEDLPCVQ